MRRPTKPWYRAFNDTWYVQFNGKQVPLAKGKDCNQEAYRRFYSLMAQQAGTLPVSTTKLQAASLFDLFLDWSKKNHDAETFDFYRRHLQSFADQFGGVEVDHRKPFHVTKWLDNKSWGPTSQNRAISCVKRALNWAVGEGLLADNPLKTVRKPPMQRRERILAEDEFQVVLTAVKDEAFRRVLLALRETGCRPSEVRRVSSEHADLNTGLWTFHKHKTKHKTGKPRIVYLTPAVVELTRELLKLHPDGLLFRNTRGLPWTRNALRIRFRNLRKKFPNSRA